jgi:hypothetical protein
MYRVRSHTNNLQKVKTDCLLKIMLFRQCQISQQIAETPIRILALVSLSIPFNQLPNILVIFTGGGNCK